MNILAIVACIQTSLLSVTTARLIGQRESPYASQSFDHASRHFISHHSLFENDENDEDREDAIRELNDECSEYTVIRMDIRYDSYFCSELADGDTIKAINYIHSVIQVMNVYYNRAPLCMAIKPCNIEGFCSEDDEDIYREMVDNNNDGNTVVNLLEPFVEVTQTNGKQRDGCDATHLFYGGPKDRPFIGYAYPGSLCSDIGFGVDQVGYYDESFAMQGALVAHELGHNLYAIHMTYGNYIMNAPLAGEEFSDASVSKMKSFVEFQKEISESPCTAETVAATLDDFPSYPEPICPGSEFLLKMQTNEFGNVVTWKLMDSDRRVVTSRTGYPRNAPVMKVRECLEVEEEYEFEIEDMSGEGIMKGDAFYEIYIDGDLVFRSSGEMGKVETVEFTTKGKQDTNEPTKEPTRDPTKGPSTNPPTGEPIKQPTTEPTIVPSQLPTSVQPSEVPSWHPTQQPSQPPPSNSSDKMSNVMSFVIVCTTTVILVMYPFGINDNS